MTNVLPAKYASAYSPIVLLQKSVTHKWIAQMMKSVLLDWAFSPGKSRAQRVNPIQRLLPMEATLPQEMVEPVVVQVDKAAWAAMVDKVVLLGKAVREALVAKAVVARRVPRGKAGRADKG